jgi:glycerol kinase
MVFNELLVQFQACLLRVPVIHPTVAETTALGAAYAAGLATGFWKKIDDLRANWGKDEGLPGIPADQSESLYRGWKRAVTRTFDWVK